MAVNLLYYRLMKVEELKQTKRGLWKAAFAKQSIYGAIKTCDFLFSNFRSIDDPVASALVTAIFVHYAKPFGDNNGVGAVSSKLAKWDTSEQQNLHDFLIHGRDKFYAHSDAREQYFDKNGPVGFLLQLNVTGKDMGDGTIELFTSITEPRLTMETIPRIKTLCQEILKRFDIEEQRCLRHLHDIGFQFRLGVNPIILQ